MTQGIYKRNKNWKESMQKKVWKNSDRNKKISNSRKGKYFRLGYKHTEEIKKKIGLGNKGKIVSQETRKKMSDSHKGKTWSIKRLEKSKLNRTHSKIRKKITVTKEESNLKRSKSNKLAYIKNPKLRENLSLMWRKEKSNLWQGGKSFESYTLDWTNILKIAIRKRDNFKCQICGKYQNELKQKLSVHHIDYNKKNCEPNNLISLCINCHIKTNSNRKFWINTFKKMKRRKKIKW